MFLRTEQQKDDKTHVGMVGNEQTQYGGKTQVQGLEEDVLKQEKRVLLLEPREKDMEREWF